MELQTVHLSECNSTVWKYNEGNDGKIVSNGIDDSQFCANGTNNCDGNSGAPLYQPQNAFQLAQIVGISSHSICDSMVPQIFTRVSYYLDWIEENVWPNDEITIPLSSIN